MLIRLIYCSEANPLRFNGAEMVSIMKASNRNNTEMGLSGLLCFTNQFFLQCLEGERNVVNEIFASIMNDFRHQNVQLMLIEDIKQRDFPDWAMGLVSDSKNIQELITAYVGADEFNPYEITGKAALDLLIELSQTIPVTK